MAILDDRKSLLIAFLAISDQYVTFCFHIMAAGGHFGSPKITINQFISICIILYSAFRSHFSPFHINTQLFFFNFLFKMAAGGHFGSPIWAILDDRKSLSIAFLAISDQYTTFFFFLFIRLMPKIIRFL